MENSAENPPKRPKMDLKFEIASHFEFINITLDEKVLQRCVKICESYQLGAEEFSNIWCAYAASTMTQEAPTVEILDSMERKQIQKIYKEKLARSPLIEMPKESKSFMEKMDTSEDNVNVVKEELTPFSRGFKEVVSEDNKVEPKQRIIENLNEDVSKFLSSYEKNAEYSQRKNALWIRFSFGPKNFQVKKRDVEVELYNENSALHPNSKYMYEVLSNAAGCLSNIFTNLGYAIVKKHNLTISENKNLGLTCNFGKIIADSMGRINFYSIMLEETSLRSRRNCCYLNIEKLGKKVGIFPGQVVAVKGKMLHDTKLVAQSIFTDCGLTLPEQPPVLNETLRIMVAAGPFTLSKSFTYDPMRDFLNFVADNQPNVLILTGPFVEENVENVEPFDVFFENLIDSISVALQDFPIKIVIIPSANDAHHHQIFPTPPYETRTKHKNIQFFHNPCMLKIDGLVLGITSVDIMYHIAKEELASSQSDPMSRLSSYLIEQQSFYPLYPPNLDVNLNCVTFEDCGTMECLPHILILPSIFNGFVRVVKDCVVVNPEKLVLNENKGGAFADIIISPGTTKSVADRTTCKIINI